MANLIKDSYVFGGGVKLQAQYEATAPSPSTGENVIFCYRNKRTTINFGGIGFGGNADTFSTTFFTGDSISFTTSNSSCTARLNAMYILRPGIDDVYKGMMIGAVGGRPNCEDGHIDEGCSCTVTNTGVTNIKSKGGQPVAIFIDLN